MMLWRRMILLALLTVIAVAGANPRALAQSSGTAEPTREQLDLQLSIMRDYIDKLEQQTLWGTGNWLSRKTAVKIEWPRQVLEAVGPRRLPRVGE